MHLWKHVCSSEIYISHGTQQSTVIVVASDMLHQTPVKAAQSELIHPHQQVQRLAN